MPSESCLIVMFSSSELALNKSLNVKWNWIKAHAGNPLNEEVDLLAKKAAELD